MTNTMKAKLETKESYLMEELLEIIQDNFADEKELEETIKEISNDLFPKPLVSYKNKYLFEHLMNKFGLNINELAGYIYFLKISNSINFTGFKRSKPISILKQSSKRIGEVIDYDSNIKAILTYIKNISQKNTKRLNDEIKGKYGLIGNNEDFQELIKSNYLKCLKEHIDYIKLSIDIQKIIDISNPSKFKYTTKSGKILEIEVSQNNYNSPLGTSYNSSKDIHIKYNNKVIIINEGTAKTINDFCLFSNKGYYKIDISLLNIILND